MAKCIHCGAATQLYVNDQPVCVACDSASSKGTETGVKLDHARAKWRAAKLKLDELSAVHRDLPPGHPDGTQAWANANAILKEAAAEFKAALDEYLASVKKPK